mgnify:CR=1 FL=1
MEYSKWKEWADKQLVIPFRVLPNRPNNKPPKISRDWLKIIKISTNLRSSLMILEKKLSVLAVVIQLLVTTVKNQ